MYPVSSAFRDYIKRNTVTFEWFGTMTDLDGTEYSLSKENIVKNTGTITRRCSQERLSIGTTCTAELAMNLYLNVDRYKLYGATIELYFRLYEGTTTNDEPITEEIPMGIFVVTECNQSSGKLSILAYDYMTKFDQQRFSISLDNAIQEPTAWLNSICSACGVTLGNTSAEIAGMPNGTRPTGFADVVSEQGSWKDVLGYLSAYLGGFAYIGRDGKLYIGHYTSGLNDTITASFRKSSNLSDFRTTYDGLYATYKDGGVQEYVSNNNSGGLVLDLGTNPFLQISNQQNRLDALQEIIDSWNGVYYVPYESSMPILPHYDLGDVIKFTNNQAAQYDYGAITEIVYNLSGTISIVSCGDNPILADAQDRFTKTVAGLSQEYNNGQEVGTKNFWLLHTENTQQLTISNNVKTKVAEIEFKQKTDVQRMGLMFTSEVDFPTTSKVRVLITIDDSQYYGYLRLL